MTYQRNPILDLYDMYLSRANEIEGEEELKQLAMRFYMEAYAISPAKLGDFFGTVALGGTFGSVVNNSFFLVAVAEADAETLTDAKPEKRLELLLQIYKDKGLNTNMMLNRIAFTLWLTAARSIGATREMLQASEPKKEAQAILDLVSQVLA